MSRQETLPKKLLRLKKRTSWSWERMCREFHRVMGEEGPSHTTLFRYAVGKVRRRNVLTERYVKEAIDKVTVELMKQKLSEKGIQLQQEPVEKEVQQSEIPFRKLIENARILIYRYRRSPLGCEYINPVVKDILGYTPEEFYTDPELVLKIIHPEDKSRLKSAPQNGRNTTHRLIRKDGRVVWCEGVRVAVYDESGNWVATEGISRDISDREPAETSL